MSDLLWIVSSEWLADRLALAAPCPAETRRALRSRLLRELSPAVELAGRLACRLALARVLPDVVAEDSRLAEMAREGGVAWQRITDDFDLAVGWARRVGGLHALTRVGEGADSVGRRARLLAGAVRALDEELRRAGLTDERSADEWLAEVLRRTEPREVLRAVGSRQIVAKGMVSWEPTELAWWRALDESLVRFGGRAVLELPVFDEPLDATRLRSVLDQVTESIAAALDDAPETMRIKPALGDLRFVGGPDPEVRARVEIRRAFDVQAQTHAAVAAIHRALANGVEVDQIVVAVPRGSEEGASRALLRACHEAGIAAHDPRGEAPAAAPLVAFALEALDAAVFGAPRAAVADVVRSPYADAAALSGVADPKRAARALDRLGRLLELAPDALGDEGKQGLEATVELWETREGRPGLESFVPIARRVAAALARATDGQTRPQRLAALRELWRDLGLEQAARPEPRDLEAARAIGRAGLAAVARDARGWWEAQAALDGYAEAVGRLGLLDRPVSAEELRHEIGMALGEPTAPPEGARAGAVAVRALADVGGEPLGLLVVLGANEELLIPNELAASLFSSEVEARVRELDQRVPGPGFLAARSMAELALAASSAERTVLVVRDRDASGEPLTPSPVVTWLARGGVESTSWGPSRAWESPVTPRDARLGELAARPDRAEAMVPRAARKARREWAREAFFAGASVQHELVGFLFRSAACEQALTQETGGGATPMGLTALESFAVCPFRGYAAQILGARERRVAEDVPGALDEGSLVHGALAAAFGATAALWSARPRDVERIRREATAAVDAFLVEGRIASGPRRMAHRLARRDVARVIEWSLADLDWDFVEAEKGFGDGKQGSLDAVRLDDGITRVAFRGKIDRIDRAHGRSAVRAVDYKLSESSAVRHTRQLAELAFQLPLYGLAAAAWSGGTLDACMYLPTRARSLAAGYVTKGSQEAWTRAQEREGEHPRFVARALAVVAEVRSGALAPTPRDERVCELCGFDGGCRKPRFPVEEPDRANDSEP